MPDSPAYLLHRVVFDMDRAADRLLRQRLSISYKRALFLLILKLRGTVTQHELAVALGYSDPAVSTMLLELAKEGFVQTAPSPKHGRKRLVTITRKGMAIVAKTRQFLDSQFAQLMESAGVDARHYSQLTEQIHRALVAKMNEDDS